MSGEAQRGQGLRTINAVNRRQRQHLKVDGHPANAVHAKIVPGAGGKEQGPGVSQLVHVAAARVELGLYGGACRGGRLQAALLGGSALIIGSGKAYIQPAADTVALAYLAGDGHLEPRQFRIEAAPKR